MNVLNPSGLTRARLLAPLFALVLAGCGSSVKLNEDVKVEEGKTQTAQPLAATPAVTPPLPSLPPAQPQATEQRRVEPVTTQPPAAQTQPPANVARIVYFDYDSYEIKPEFQATLDAHARFLKANGVRKVNLEGHTDERGGREYNLALGQKRAEAVARALRVLGVADAQTEAVSFGKEKPVAPGSDEAAWSKNRRVELFYK